MMAKIVKGKAFKGAINYILDKQKNTEIVDFDGLRELPATQMAISSV